MSTARFARPRLSSTFLAVALPALSVAPVVEMVSSKITPNVPMEKLHLRLALGAIDDSNAKEVEHHLQHYVEGASAHDRRHAEQLLTLVREGDLLTVKKRIAHLLGA
jgi:hypothetical protein